MTMARKHLVDPSVTRWYHCLTRYVRRAFLLGEGPKDCKQWIEKRIEEFARIFSISVGGFSILDTHRTCCETSSAHHSDRSGRSQTGSRWHGS